MNLSRMSSTSRQFGQRGIGKNCQRKIAVLVTRKGGRELSTFFCYLLCVIINH
jgi:hypothetical protein